MSVLQRELDAYESAFDLYQQAARRYNKKAKTFNKSLVKQDGLVVVTKDQFVVPRATPAYYTVNEAGELSAPFNNDAYATMYRAPIKDSPGYYLLQNTSSAVNGVYPQAPGAFNRVKPAAPNASFVQYRKLNQMSLADQERGGLLQDAMSASVY